jgi:hypothetical protein
VTSPERLLIESFRARSGKAARGGGLLQRFYSGFGGAFLALSAFFVVGCETMPRDAFRLSETALETRQMQTREYESVSDIRILSSSSAVLQDMGYVIDEVEKPLGVLSASKRADARNDMETLGNLAVDATQCVLTFFVGCSGQRYRAGDAVQDIRLTLVALPVRDKAETTAVRVTMQRIIWSRDERLSEQETIADPDVYQAFFQKLSKSVFLEQEGL